MFLTTTLALLAPPQLPELPDPPLLDRFLLENPYPLAVGLAVAGAIAAFVLAQRGKPKPGLLAILAAAVLAGAAVLTGELVTTERERVIERSRELVFAVGERDFPTVRELVRPDVELFYFQFRGSAGLDHIESQLDSNFGQSVDINSVRVTDVQAAIDNQSYATTQVGVSVKSTAGAQFGLDERALRTWWKLYWYREPGTPPTPWKVAEIELLWINLPGVDNPSGR